MAPDNETPNAAMLTAVSQFAKELAELKQTESEERAELRRDVELSNTALRHDMYGTTTYLAQQIVELRIDLQSQREDSHEWRSDMRADREVERAARESGQKVNRWLSISVLILVVIALGGVVALLVKVF